MDFFSKIYPGSGFKCQLFPLRLLTKSAYTLKTRTCRKFQDNVKLKQISGSVTTFNNLSLTWHTYNAADEKITKLNNFSFAPQ